MYEITCFRAFDPKKIYNSTNRKAKGQFTLKFNTLEEIAKWYCSKRIRSIVICKTNLTKQETHILSKKIYSLNCRKLKL